MGPWDFVVGLRQLDQFSEGEGTLGRAEDLFNTGAEMPRFATWASPASSYATVREVVCTLFLITGASY